MCGRYTITKSIDEICDAFKVENSNNIYNPSYNITPNQNLPVITNENSKSISYINWGLVPFWAKDKKISNKLINSRVETILEKPSFKYAIKKRRCLVISDGYYEWKNESNNKVPYRIVLSNNNLFAMAGIWEEWKKENNNSYYSFSIITQQANDKLLNIHHRMPAILSKKHHNDWLFNKNVDEALSVIKPIDNNAIDYYKVSKEVNIPGNNYIELITPIT